MELSIVGDEAELFFKPDERLVFLRKAANRLIDAANRHTILDTENGEAEALGELLHSLPSMNYHASLHLDVAIVPFVIRCFAYQDPPQAHRPQIASGLEKLAQDAAKKLQLELNVELADLTIPLSLPEDFA